MEKEMTNGLKINPGGLFDFMSLGALVHRLDPGIIPFRKATECKIHVSGGEFNVAANLADCFRLNTGIVTAKVNYRITSYNVCYTKLLRSERINGRCRSYRDDRGRRFIF